MIIKEIELFKGIDYEAMKIEKEKLNRIFQIFGNSFADAKVRRVAFI